MKTFPPKEAGSGSPDYPGHRRLQLHVRLSKPYGSQVPAEILESSEPRRIIPGERPIGLICSHLGPTTDSVFWNLPKPRFSAAKPRFWAPCRPLPGVLLAKLFLVQGTHVQTQRLVF